MATQHEVARAEKPVGRRDHRLILRVLERMNRPLVSTALVKLIYLTDYLYFQNFGETITGYRYEWDNYGPNAVGHAIINEAKSLAEDSRIRMKEEPNIYGSVTTKFQPLKLLGNNQLEPAMELALESIVHQYGRLPLKKLVAATKQTKPFANIQQYDVIEMEQSTPAVKGDDADWARYQQDVKKYGLLSLEELEEVLSD